MMAENKKSFVAYCDWGEIFDELDNEEAGKLVKHLFDYVRDKNPKAEDKLTKMMFIQIQQSLKRDLKKYENYIDKQSLNGKKGGRPKNPNNPTLFYKTQPLNGKPKKADSVNVNVSDTVTVTVNDNVINKKEGLIFPFDSIEFKETWKMWKEYKKDEHKFNYKSIISEQAALKSLSDDSNCDEQMAIKIIMQSIENGWKGFFKIQNNGKQKGYNKIRPEQFSSFINKER
jgi:hypothetical protein